MFLLANLKNYNYELAQPKLTWFLPVKTLFNGLFLNQGKHTNLKILYKCSYRILNSIPQTISRLERFW